MLVVWDPPPKHGAEHSSHQLKQCCLSTNQIIIAEKNTSPLYPYFGWLNEMRTFLCRLSINDCNKLIIYLSTYFTTNKKVYIMFSLCVSLELSKLTVVTTSLSTLSSNFSKGKNFYLVGGSVYYCLVTSDSSYHHATGLNN